MRCRRRWSLWALRSPRQRWQQDTAAGGLAGATLAALVVALVVLAASIWQAPGRPLLATPLTAATLLLGSAWLLDGVSTHDLGDGIALDGRNIGGNHLMYGRVPRFGRGGVFLGYSYPDPAICDQFADYYNPAVGCYGMYPLG
jgi:hypothetical protein